MPWKERYTVTDERTLDEVANIGEIVQFGDQAREERRLHVVEQLLEARNDGDRRSKRRSTRRWTRRARSSRLTAIA